MGGVYPHVVTYDADVDEETMTWREVERAHQPYVSYNTDLTATTRLLYPPLGLAALRQLPRNREITPTITRFARGNLEALRSRRSLCIRNLNLGNQLLLLPLVFRILLRHCHHRS